MLPSKYICWSLIIGMVQLAYMVLPVQGRSCGHLGEVTNGKYILEGVEFGARAAVTCDTGYTLVGSGVRNCLAEGWDGRVPVCEVVKCGKPPTIVNGGPVIPPEDEYSYRSVVEYSCEKEFTLVGTKSIVCEKDGEFQPAPPECKMVSCPAPVVENGVRIQGRSPPYKHKSFVTYKCNDGYEMTGEASLTCEIEGWSASIPTCKGRSCGHLGEVTNGKYILEGVEFGARAAVTCDTGYTLVGSGVRNCLAEGWDGRVPVCEVVKCGKPPTIVNGGPVIPPEDEYSYRSVVEYSCEKEFTLVGTKSIVCEKDGEFQPAPPECKMVSCPAPVVENGVRIQGRSPPYKHKSFVTYKCNDGYEMTGEASLTCEIEGWSASIPTCKGRSCGHLGEVTNGKYILEGVEFGARAAVTCDTGYTLVGSGVRNCLAEGWDGRVPVCEVVKCGKPPTIVNGGPVIPPEDEYSYRSVVEYSCEKEFTLVGTKSIVCEKDGEFQPAPPECKMVSCPAPVVENGVRIQGRSPPYKHKSFVTYKCNDGYEMTGEASLTCEIEGWSASIPTCKGRSCGHLGEVTNGKYILEGVEFGARAAVTCDTGYTLVGSGVRNCLAEGWDGRVPVCEVVKCGKPPTIVNGGPVIPPEDEYSYRSVVEYSCEKEFTLVGTKSIVCEKDGEFQPAPPECKMVSCPAPVVENGVRIQGRSPPYKHKSFVTYKCNDGYEMTGEASLTCEIEGWSASIPTCKGRSCGHLGEVTNGKYILEGVEFGARAAVTCDTGYTLVGSGVRNCLAEGWDGRVPVCEVVKCGKPPTIVNGGPVIPPEDEYSYRSVVEYSCEKEFTLVGTKSIVCEKDGEFQPAPPECKMVSCPAPVVENGVRIEGRSPPYKHKSYVMYKCNDGYKMTGEASLTCEIEGWSASIPICKATDGGAGPTDPPAANHHTWKIVGVF